MNYTVIQEFNEDLILEVYELFKNEWWTQNRDPSSIKELISNSGVSIGILSNETNELIGFARVITDTLYRAFIFDVITKKSYRDNGIGTLLINEILEHPKVANVERVELYCPDRLVSYYEKFSFSTEVNGSKLMRLNKIII
ncbi:GNAT family N-acetyltransferase [Fictibacillus nanhaiensis]|uniref:GNAT family N-acetyltransferase n=1 Tax=Fictibacillus nanhaiensis TaxID=742169 RepID=A0ABS2ZSF8_9BACL|nr:GNAT family N-acetyltransferase [Fictibacillus nanhaiensis]